MYVSCCGDVKCCILMFECYMFHFFACVSVLFVCCAVNVLYYSEVFVITCFMFGAVKALYVEMFVCYICLLYTSPSPRDATLSRMPSSA